MNSKITLLGGSLGAGKTTLVSNLIRNGSFQPQKDGIVVMDAAGNIDFQRINSLAQEYGIDVKNATSTCTVCDGPNAAFNKIKELEKEGIENILIELSGQMPLSTMRGKLDERGYFDSNALYLFDPRHFGLVGAADEIGYSDLIGVTKHELDPDTKDLIKEYTFDGKVPIIQIIKENDLTLKELIRRIPTDSNPPFKPIVPHFGCRVEGETTKYSGKVENPYYRQEDIRDLVEGVAEDYDRVKGYVALDSQRILSFDGVKGEVEFEVIEDSNLGNGTILVANQDGSPFKSADLEAKLSNLVEKPDYPPVIRINSSKDLFERYIETAISSGEYDSALAAGEQYNFEREDTSLISAYAPRIFDGMWSFISDPSSSLDLSQKVAREASLLYGIHEYMLGSRIRGDIENSFISNYGTVDRNQLSGLVDEETLEFIDEMYSTVSKREELV